MSSKRDPRIGWKKEAVALALGLLLGSAWEVAHAGVRSVASDAHAALARRS